MTGSFVTESVGTLLRGEGFCLYCEESFPQAKTGRPKRFCRHAHKVAYYRAAGRPTAVLPGAKCRTAHGKGIILHTGPVIRVIYRENDRRVWREHSAAEVTVLTAPVPFPQWVKGRHRPGRVNRMSRLFDPTTKTAKYDPSKDPKMGYMPGENEYAVRRYTVRRAGKGKKFKDYSKLIDSTLANYIDAALGGN